MPDKSKCQHLFLCCQFFMVFDDISPIVRPTYAASCPLSVARCWPLLGPCVPIWLNRTCTVDAGSGNSCWLGHRSVLFANAWALLFGFLSQELWLSPPPRPLFQWWNISSDARHSQPLQNCCNWINFSGKRVVINVAVSPVKLASKAREPKHTVQRPMQPNPACCSFFCYQAFLNLNCLLFSEDLWQAR